MRASFTWFVFSMLLLAGVSFAQAAEIFEASLTEKPLIRMISAEEAVEPVQPPSVIYEEREGGISPTFEGSAKADTVSTGVAESNYVSDQIYSEFCKCRECCGGFSGASLDNTIVWAGFDTFRSRGDGITILGPISPPLGNSTGAVAGFNTAVSLGDSAIQAQFGASYGIYDWKGRWFPISDASPEQQTFITLGVSKRSNIACGDRIAWGLVFDQMFDHQWGFFADEIYLTQFRFIGAYAINECHEVGFMGTVHTQSDIAQDLGILLPGLSSRIRTMNQANLFWRQNWEFGGTTTAYVGFLDQADVGDWLFGLQGTAPLSHYVSIYGNFTYVAPASGSGLFGSSLEQWNLSFGLAYSFGARSVSPNVSGPQGLPLLPVANNGTFLVTD